MTIESIPGRELQERMRKLLDDMRRHDRAHPEEVAELIHHLRFHLVSWKPLSLTEELEAETGKFTK